MNHHVFYRLPTEVTSWFRQTFSPRNCSSRLDDFASVVVADCCLANAAKNGVCSNTITHCKGKIMEIISPCPTQTSCSTTNAFKTWIIQATWAGEHCFKGLELIHRHRKSLRWEYEWPIVNVGSTKSMPYIWAEGWTWSNRNLRQQSHSYAGDVCGSTLFGGKKFLPPNGSKVYKNPWKKLSLGAICSFHGNLERWSCHSSNRNHLPKPSDCNELHEDHVIHNINMANTYRLAWMEILLAAQAWQLFT